MLVLLLVLPVLVGVVDRVGAAVAGRALAGQLQTSGGLSERPDVTIGGFPFLTQALGGRYRSIDVRATGVLAGDVRLRSLDARLTGARVPLSDALSGSVGSVPVDAVDATVLLSYADLARRARGRELTVSPAGDRVRVRGSVRVLGQQLAVSAVSRIAVEGDQVVVTAETYEVGNGVADAVLTRALAGRLDFRFRLGRLPYGLRVSGVQVQPDGVAVRAGARDTVLAAP